MSAPRGSRILAILREQIDAIRGHEAGARRGTDPEDVHDMRTAARCLRAILRAVRSGFELAEEEIGRPAARFVDKAKKVQDILGEHQDAVVAEWRIRVCLRGIRRPAAWFRDRLIELQRARHDRLRN